jgi:type III pantothenate kinase
MVAQRANELMNIVAIDIGNTNVAIGLFLDGKDESIQSIPGEAADKVRDHLAQTWSKIPVLESSSEGKRDGVIVVSSVKPAWTELIRRIAEEDLKENIRLIGDDIPLPISAWVDEPAKVGTDRIVAAAAAFDVVEDAVVVADLGTAVTIDLVDEHGAFQGGVICPGFEMSAKALNDDTALLPKITVHRPDTPYGKNTTDAINCGLYYSIIGAMEEIIRRYAEQLGHWPQTIITGSAAAMLKDDLPFIDNYVPNLVVKGVVLAYMKYIAQQSETV